MSLGIWNRSLQKSKTNGTRTRHWRYLVLVAFSNLTAIVIGASLGFVGFSLAFQAQISSNRDRIEVMQKITTKLEQRIAELEIAFSEIPSFIRKKNVNVKSGAR